MGIGTTGGSVDGDERRTPPELFYHLHRLFQFNLDPCSTHDNALTEFYYTQEEDGLCNPWSICRCPCHVRTATSPNQLPKNSSVATQRRRTDSILGAMHVTGSTAEKEWPLGGPIQSNAIVSTPKKCATLTANAAGLLNAGPALSTTAAADNEETERPGIGIMNSGNLSLSSGAASAPTAADQTGSSKIISSRLAVLSTPAQAPPTLFQPVVTATEQRHEKSPGPGLGTLLTGECCNECSRSPARVWANVPYSRGQLGLWLEKARHEADTNGTLTVALIPGDSSTKWWRQYVRRCADHVEELERRIAFLDPATGLPDKAGAKFPSVLAFYWPNLTPPMVRGKR